MPPRSNDFQRLVRLIHSVTLPPGAKIIESAMVSAPGFGDLYEVDILAEIDAGTFKIKVAIEAKDHKRKLSRVDIDTISGKYRVAASPVVDKIVFVSRNGFSNAAVTKARAVGVELLTLDAVKGLDWRKYFPPCFHQLPCELRVNSVPPILENVSVSTHQDISGKQDSLLRALVACGCCTKQHGTFEHFVQTKLLFGNDIRQWAESPGETQRRQFHFSLHPLILILVDGTTVELCSISLDVRTMNGKTSLDFTPYELKGENMATKVVHHGTGMIGGKQMDFVVGPEAKVIQISFHD